MIALHLNGRVGTSRDELEAFLGRAREVYERPGGIRVRLLWDRADPDVFIEVMEYADAATYERDQVRVETDPEMRALIREWHTHLAGPPRVVVFDEAELPGG